MNFKIRYLNSSIENPAISEIKLFPKKKRGIYSWPGHPNAPG